MDVFTVIAILAVCTSVFAGAMTLKNFLRSHSRIKELEVEIGITTTTLMELSDAIEQADEVVQRFSKNNDRKSLWTDCTYNSLSALGASSQNMWNFYTSTALASWTGRTAKLDEDEMKVVFVSASVFADRPTADRLREWATIVEQADGPRKAASGRPIPA